MNSSTPSEPSSNPSSTDDRGYRVRVVYPILAEYRYAVYPNERDWRVADRPKATIFATVDDARIAIEVINANSDIKAVGGRAEFETITSFDPDWCSAPEDTIRECLSMRGLTESDLAVKLGLSGEALRRVFRSGDPYSAELATKLADLLGGTPGFWHNRNDNFRDGLRKGLTVVK